MGLEPLSLPRSTETVPGSAPAAMSTSIHTFAVGGFGCPMVAATIGSSSLGARASAPQTTLPPHAPPLGAPGSAQYHSKGQALVLELQSERFMIVLAHQYDGSMSTCMLELIVAALPTSAGGPYLPTATESAPSSVLLKLSTMESAVCLQPDSVGPVAAALALRSPYASGAAAAASRTPTGLLSRGCIPPMNGAVPWGR